MGRFSPSLLALAATACGASYPAFSPDVPQIGNAGGPVLPSPKIVAVTFADDALAADLDRFVGTVGASDYWSATTAEYGVGPATALPPVMLAETAPPAIRDSEIATWLAGKLDGTHPEFPPPDDQTLYVLFFPDGTQVTLDLPGQAEPLCQRAFGYHKDTALPDGRAAAYAVIPRCPTVPAGYPSPGLALVTGTASHELVEAVTDPHPLTTPAWNAIDPDDGLLQLVGSEVGDLCAALESPPPFIRDGDGFTVQRTWSNASARAGHDPCVPAPDLPYFGSVPQLPDHGTISYGGRTIGSRALKVPVGSSRTVEVKLFSDRETSSPWAFAEQHMGSNFAVHFDDVVGKNGDTLHMTVTSLHPIPADGSGLLVLVSSLGTRQVAWLGLVTN